MESRNKHRLLPSPTSAEPAIVLLSHGFQTSYERGFTNALAARGWRVILLGSDDTDAAALAPSVRWFNPRGSQLPGRGLWRRALTLLRYHVCVFAYTGWRRGSVVHLIGLTDPPLLRGVILGLWLRLWASRYVLTVHNQLPHRPVSALQARFYRWTYRLADCVVVHTERMRRELAAGAGLDESRIVVMEHGCELPPALPLASPSPTRLQLLFFGRIEPYKGLEVLLDALAQMPGPWCLTIAGSARDAGLATALRERIARHPATTQIDWRDAPVPEAALPALFGAAHALVLPYLHIDQSGVLLQALRFGVPVVATRVGAFVDYVDSSWGELCAPGDAADLAHAIERLATRLPLLVRSAIAERARRYAWEQTVSVLDRVYRGSAEAVWAAQGKETG